MAVERRLILTSLLGFDEIWANILPKSSSASLMEKLESSSLGGVAVVMLLTVIARSLAVLFVPRRLLSSGCTACTGGISLVSLLALRLSPKDQVRPALLRKFAFDGGRG